MKPVERWKTNCGKFVTFYIPCNNFPFKVYWKLFEQWTSYDICELYVQAIFTSSFALLFSINTIRKHFRNIYIYRRIITELLYVVYSNTTMLPTITFESIIHWNVQQILQRFINLNSNLFIRKFNRIFSIHWSINNELNRTMYIVPMFHIICVYSLYVYMLIQDV